jgi:16S rRNA processing protein RimM
LIVGKLRRPHGVRGELLMDVLTDFPERLRAGLTVFVSDAHQPMKLTRCRGYENAFLVTLEGISDVDQAGEHRNQLVFVRADEIPELTEGDFYHHQLLGMRAVSDEGRFLGNVIEILETGANDVFIVRDADGPEVLLPFIDSVILNIDVATGEMRVHLIEGLG